MLGDNIKKLGFGLMRLPRIAGKEDVIDIEQTKQMVDEFMAAGFTYFDTAWAYPGSEDAIRQALVERYPREKFQLATKCRVDRLQVPGGRNSPVHHITPSVRRGVLRLLPSPQPRRLAHKSIRRFRSVELLPE